LSVIANKVDLLAVDALADLVDRLGITLGVSAKTGQGIEALRQHLLDLAGFNQQIEGVYSARRRHIQALFSARESTDAALSRLELAHMPEIAAEELRLAHDALQTITGRFDTEDLLGEIFSSFCVGK